MRRDKSFFLAFIPIFLATLGVEWAKAHAQGYPDPVEVCARQLAQKLDKDLGVALEPKKADVVRVAEKWISLGMGTRGGVREGMEFEVFEVGAPIEDESGKVLDYEQTPVGRVRVKTALENTSMAEVVKEEEGKQIAVGNKAYWRCKQIAYTVGPFVLSGPKPERCLLSLELETLLFTELQKRPEFQKHKPVVQRDQIISVLQEIRLSKGGLIGKNLKELGLEGADAVVVGTLFPREKEVNVVAQILEVETGLVLANATANILKTRDVEYKCSRAIATPKSSARPPMHSGLATSPTQADITTLPTKPDTAPGATAGTGGVSGSLGPSSPSSATVDQSEAPPRATLYKTAVMIQPKPPVPIGFEEIKRFLSTARIGHQEVGNYLAWRSKRGNTVFMSRDGATFIAASPFPLERLDQINVLHEELIEAGQLLSQVKSIEIGAFQAAIASQAVYSDPPYVYKYFLLQENLNDWGRTQRTFEVVVPLQKVKEARVAAGGLLEQISWDAFVVAQSGENRWWPEKYAMLNADITQEFTYGRHLLSLRVGCEAPYWFVLQAITESDPVPFRINNVLQGQVSRSIRELFP